MEFEILMVYWNKKIESIFDFLYCFIFDFKSSVILILNNRIFIYSYKFRIKMGNKGKKYIENVVCYLCGFCMRLVYSKL